MQKIVTIGGGTGHFQLLKGLKNYECELKAVVNMFDNGGSSGKLRDEYGVLPPGDIRQCIVALAHEEESELLRDVFNYRFNGGHNLGNLIITALTEIYKDTFVAIQKAGKLLKIKGKVLPVTIDNCTLMAETLNGILLNGENDIHNVEGVNTRIIKLYHKPKSFLHRESAKAIKEAGKIVICPGDLYGSILPNFIVEGMQKVLKESRAIKVYVANLFTKQGTYNFKASDFVREIEKYSGIKIDKVIINKGMLSKEVINKYFSENSKLVEDDMEDDERVVRGEFAKEYLSEKNTILRHIPEETARAIISL